MLFNQKSIQNETPDSKTTNPKTSGFKTTRSKFASENYFVFSRV